MLLEQWILMASGGAPAVANGTPLFTLGTNDKGQLGIDSILNASSPVQVGTSEFLKIATGSKHTLAIKDDFTLWAWGDNSYGQLGDGTFISRSSPVQIGSGTYKDISACENSSFAISQQNKLYAWGDNEAGQLGNNDLVAGAESWVVVSAGGDISGQYNQSAGIKSDGSLWVWGQNGISGFGAISRSTEYILGDEIPLSAIQVNHKSSPVQIGIGQSWRSVNMKQKLALTTDGKLFSWGRNQYGTLGNNTSTDERSAYSPIQIAAGTSFNMLPRGDYGHIFKAAIDNLGRLYTWGLNNADFALVQAGGGLNNDFSRPTQIVGTQSWSQVALTGGGAFGGNIYAGAAIAVVGSRLWTWGSYQLNGQNTLTTILSPTQLGTSAWQYVTAGGGTFYAIDNSFRLFYWGSDPFGLSDHKSSPTQIGVGIQFFSVETSGSSGFTVARTTSDVIYAWGTNSFGEFGNSSINFSIFSTPTFVGNSWGLPSSSMSEDRKIACGSKHLLTIIDGKLHTAGSNRFGQLGTNKQREFKSSPTQIGSRFNSPIQIGNSSWSLVSSGGNFTHAIRADGTLWGWGRNLQINIDNYKGANNTLFNSTVEYGQLGDGTSIDRSSPVQIGTSSWSYIQSAPNGMTFGISNGALYTIGQLANFAPLNGAPLVQKISNTALFDRSTLIKDDGSLWFTFSDPNNVNNVLDNTNGPYSWIYDKDTGFITRRAGFDWAFAQGWSTSNVKGPYHATKFGNNTFSQVSANRNTGAAIDTTGRLFMWGKNLNGQCGQDSTVVSYYSSPVQIGTSSWNMVAVGNNNVVAIRADGTLWGWGLNENGEGGTFNRIPRSSPVQIGTSSWSFVSMGEDAVFGISAGRLYSWGYGLNGNLGQLTNTSLSAPVQVAFTISANTWVKAGGDNYRTFGLLANGQIWGWGLGNNGVFGKNTNTSINYLDSATLGGPYSDFTYYTHTGTCHAISTDGSLWVLGGSIGNENNGLNNIVSNGSTIRRSSPSQIGASDSSLSFLGFTGTIEGHLKVSNSLSNTFLMSTWGNIKPGINGNINASDRISTRQGFYSIHDAVPELTPILVNTSNNWVKVSAGKSGALAINSSNNLFQLETADNLTKFIKIDTESGTYGHDEQSFSGNNASITGFSAIRSDGRAFYWGVLANNDINISQNAVSHLRGKEQEIGGSWSQISTGERYSFGIKSDGTLWFWGRNNNGIAGSGAAGNTTTFILSPTQIGSSTWSKIHTSTEGRDNNGYAFAIRSDGTLWTWGKNSSTGRLGLGDTLSRSTPTQIGSDTWSHIDSNFPAGVTHGIKTNGTLWGWGNALLIGDGGTGAKSAPVQIGSNTWISVYSGRFSAGVQSDGKLYVWGDNGRSSGIYDARTASLAGYLSQPTQVGSANNWTKVFGCKYIDTYSSYGIYALNNKNELYANFGTNYYSQIGNGTKYASSSYNRTGEILVQIPGKWADVAHHGRYTLALDTDGLLYFWGFNIHGAVGDFRGLFDNPFVVSPVQIGNGFKGTSFTQIGSANGDTWNAVSSGNGINLAISNNGKLHAWGRNKQTILPASNNINVPITTADNTVIATNTVNVSIDSSHVAILKEL